MAQSTEEIKQVPPAAGQPERPATQPEAGKEVKTAAAAEKPAEGVAKNPADAGQGQQTVAEPPVSPKKEIPAAVEPAKSEAPAIIFKVQLVAVSKEPSLNPDDYNGLPGLPVEKHQKVYRVLYGNTPSYEEAQRLQSFAALRGYPSSYIVAYQNGERIPLPDALSALSQ